MIWCALCPANNNTHKQRKANLILHWQAQQKRNKWPCGAWTLVKSDRILVMYTLTSVPQSMLSCVLPVAVLFIPTFCAPNLSIIWLHCTLCVIMSGEVMVWQEKKGEEREGGEGRTPLHCNNIISLERVWAAVVGNGTLWRSWSRRLWHNKFVYWHE